MSQFDEYHTHQITNPLDVVALGSSGTEVIDYVIGKHPQYHPFWAPGWSARGLCKEQTLDYIETILRPISRDSIVLLHFGGTDVMMNARHKAITEGFINFPGFIQDASDGIMYAHNLIMKLGFHKAVPVFFSPIPHQPQSYWDRFNKARQLPTKMMARMYFDIFDFVTAECETLDIFDEASQGEDGSFVLKPQFKRAEPEHHADYTKLHGIVAAKLATLSGMLPLRQTPLDSHYPHPMYSFKELMAAGATRPNTCR